MNIIKRDGKTFLRMSKAEYLGISKKLAQVQPDIALNQTLEDKMIDRDKFDDERHLPSSRHACPYCRGTGRIHPEKGSSLSYECTDCDGSGQIVDYEYEVDQAVTVDDGGESLQGVITSREYDRDSDQIMYDVVFPDGEKGSFPQSSISLA